MDLKDKISSLIFDLDGVLWNTSPLHEQAYRQTYQEFGLPTHFDYRQWAGRKTADCVREFVAQHSQGAVDEALVEKLTKRKQFLALQLIHESKPLVPDCLRILKQLSTQMSLALASSASPGSVQAFLNLLDEPGLFDVVLTSEDVHKAKPDPEIFQKAARGLRRPGNMVAVVEDSLSGILAARQANFLAIGIAGTESEDRLLQAGAFRVFPDLKTFADEMGSRWVL